MAKKRRKRRRDQIRRRPPVALRPERVKPEEEGRASTEVGAVSWAEEYPYVYQDLKRIAILAASVFAVMIILSFVIR